MTGSQIFTYCDNSSFLFSKSFYLWKISWLHQVAYRFSVSWPGWSPRPLHWKREPSHWTTGEVPIWKILQKAGVADCSFCFAVSPLGNPTGSIFKTYPEKMPLSLLSPPWLCLVQVTIISSFGLLLPPPTSSRCFFLCFDIFSIYVEMEVRTLSPLWSKYFYAFPSHSS